MVAHSQHKPSVHEADHHDAATRPKRHVAFQPHVQVFLGKTVQSGLGAEAAHQVESGKQHGQQKKQRPAYSEQLA